jgi:hypothetical protein
MAFPGLAEPSSSATRTSMMGSSLESGLVERRKSSSMRIACPAAALYDILHMLGCSIRVYVLALSVCEIDRWRVGGNSRYVFASGTEYNSRTCME